MFPLCVSSGTDSTSPQCLWQETAAAEWLWQVKPPVWPVSVHTDWICAYSWSNCSSSVPACSSIQREDARAPPGVSLLLLHPSWTQRLHGRREGRSATLFNPSEIHYRTAVCYYDTHRVKGSIQLKCHSFTSPDWMGCIKSKNGCNYWQQQEKTPQNDPVFLDLDTKVMECRNDLTGEVLIDHFYLSISY